MTSDGAARGELSLLGLSRVVTELERSSRGVGVLWPLQGTLHKSRPSLGALNLETSERSSAGLQPSAIRPQPSSLLPHLGQKRYEQNCQSALSIFFIINHESLIMNHHISSPAYFIFFPSTVHIIICMSLTKEIYENSHNLQTKTRKNRIITKYHKKQTANQVLLLS